MGAVTLSPAPAPAAAAAPYFPPISSAPVLQSTSSAAAGAGLKVTAPKKTQSDGEHNSQNFKFHLFYNQLH